MDIDFTTPEAQSLVMRAVDSGDLRFKDGHRLLFPQEKATQENMELRELYDNANLYRGDRV